jgi:hypothetical protein
MPTSIENLFLGSSAKIHQSWSQGDQMGRFFASWVIVFFG